MPITRTTVTTLYTFDELGETAQQAALERLCGINVDHGWWDCILEDAGRIGLRIDEFDIDRDTISGCLTENPEDVIAAILKEHGEECDTYKTAKVYQQQYDTTLAAYIAEDPEDSDERSLRDTQWYDEFCHELCHALKEDYLCILREEYEYLTSEEAIKGAIEATEYLFTEDGELA